MDRKRLYSIWRGMLRRCNSPKCLSYPRYGANGIKVQFKDFNEFYNWAILNDYQASLTIHRIDSKEGYYPNNCTWKTYKEQNRDRSSVRYFTAFEETKCLTDWVEDKRCVAPRTTVHRRLKSGWEFEKAILTKPLNRGKYRKNEKKED